MGHVDSNIPASSAAATATAAITPIHRNLITAITDDVRIYFQNPAFDASHDFVHVQRVVELAKVISREERQHKQHQAELDENIVILGALLHDVADHKYRSDSGTDLITAQSLLLKHGVSVSLADKVQTIVANVSYSNELQYPGKVAALCSSIPELAIVQDADRLDALGAVGIGRLFTFGGARRRELETTVGHCEAKLLKLEGMMKTETGRRMAAERTTRLKDFLGWWEEEWSILK